MRRLGLRQWRCEPGWRKQARQKAQQTGLGEGEFERKRGQLVAVVAPEQPGGGRVDGVKQLIVIAGTNAVKRAANQSRVDSAAD